MLGLVAASSLGTVAAVVAGYNTMAPQSQLYGRTFIGLKPGNRQLALTFDDGPNDPYTHRILEVLARHSVRATFFVIGRFVKQRPQIAREIRRAGHIVGNHTYSHPNLIFQSQSKLRRQIRDCERAYEDAVGEKLAPLFRPPYGGRRPAVLRTLRSLALTPVMWSASAWDWRLKSAGEIERKVVSQIRGGDVILMHDGGHTEFAVNRVATVEALDRLVARYLGEGYRFVTIPEMVPTKGSGRK
ncbi:MAG TPA: polysaccharide deacetylase family protein [Terriglobales bacterium]|nr:polysaccharide deacetylase family protein [Terriglobales bacterium]